MKHKVYSVMGGISPTPGGMTSAVLARFKMFKKLGVDYTVLSFNVPTTDVDNVRRSLIDQKKMQEGDVILNINEYY
ncbi:hypothetical protein ACAW68_03805 [Weissella confusa]|uniref:hypothetical protein n=1 Tax=Weissella confusa TaxID=1583 RepID=UPI0035A26366